eukprot:5997819-Pyramimonas_sp.AAC.2
MITKNRRACVVDHLLVATLLVPLLPARMYSIGYGGPISASASQRLTATHSASQLTRASASHLTRYADTACSDAALLATWRPPIQRS